MSAFINDWLPCIVLIVTYFALSSWLTSRRQRKEAEAVKKIQDQMVAEYKKRHGESE